MRTIITGTKAKLTPADVARGVASAPWVPTEVHHARLEPLAITWAERNKVRNVEYRTNKANGVYARNMRNIQMVEATEAIIVFQSDEVLPHTEFMVRAARRKGHLVHIVRVGL